jgi:hypothetical protein
MDPFEENSAVESIGKASDWILVNATLKETIHAAYVPSVGVVDCCHCSVTESEANPGIP